MFRERINRRYQTLSPSFRRLADFLLSQHQRAAFMSASRLAHHLDVDVATVTRFAQTLGYEGFTELSREIQDQVLDEMRQARAPIADRLASAEGPLAQTLWHDWANLEKTIAHLRPEVAADAVAALRAARRIYVCAEGVGIGLALAFANYAAMIGLGPIVLSQGPFDTAIELKELGPEDVVIGIGFSSYAYLATRVLEYARQVGAKTIGIVGQASCTAGQAADFLLTATQDESTHLPSMTAMAAIVFALVYSLCMTDVEAYNQGLMRFQNTYTSLVEGTARGEVDTVDDLVHGF